MIYDCDVSVVWIGWLFVLNNTIHGETNLICYAAEFSTEAYKVIIANVMKIYDINIKFYMQEYLKVGAL